jgi:UDP-N-acetyl-D-mannosaminuronate dehydrogenase
MSCVQTIAEPIIAVFGLSYKADVCDLRNSPSEIMINAIMTPPSSRDPVLLQKLDAIAKRVLHE